MISSARSGSIPSEGTSYLQSGPDWKNSRLRASLRLRVSSNIMPSGFVKAKLKVNSDWNKDLKIKFTVQDPCQLVRKSFGDPVAEDLRYTVKAVVGEENFIEMHPNCRTIIAAAAVAGFSSQDILNSVVAMASLKPTRF